MENNSDKILKIKQELLKEFDYKCAYCGIELELPNQMAIDHFYPKALYPEKEFEYNNLILSCEICNSIKSNNFPTDENGNPVLLNPRLSEWKEGIKFEQNGLAVGLNKRGEITTEILQLNNTRLQLVRKMHILEKKLEFKYKSTNPDYYNNFRSNIEIIKKLNNIADISNKEVRHHFFNMLYSYTITSLETYLSDAFIERIKNERKFFIRFVETFKDFKENKIKLSEIFNAYEDIDEIVIKALSEIVYHNLPKVKGIYEDTFSLKFPNISTLMKAIFIRHDLVHRSGKTKDGKMQGIESRDIIELCDEIETFVNDINNQLKRLW